MPSNQPFMYAPEYRNSTSTFDPKAVTRASWEPKPQRPVQTGPLVSFNRHPDSHMILPQRDNIFAPLGRRTKGAIKWSRRFQWLFRMLEFNGALGILILMCLFKNMNTATAYIMRVAPAFALVHTYYGVYHHCRGPTARTPGSSSAYHVFSGIADLVVLSVYAFGAYAIHQNSASWTTRLSDQKLMDTFIPAAYYTIVGTGGLHVLSLTISLWLGYMFQKISTMPPDMNPLEDHLTARPSHRKKASVATTSSTTSERPNTMSDASSQYSTPRGLPFMHTRTGSTQSFGTGNHREPALNLPNRQYQVMASNSPRNSVVSLATKHTSMSPSNRGSYMELPITELSPPKPGMPININTRSQDRLPRFTESWKPTESLVSRTNQRNRELAAQEANRQARTSKSYSALSQRYNLEDSDSEDENENHPNPLRSHPPPDNRSSYRHWTAANLSANSALTEISNNGRLPTPGPGRELTAPGSRGRDSSIQPDSFFSRQLKDAPVTIGSGRKISSGNDFEALQAGAERRRVSGKIVEEGMGGY